MQPTYYIYTRHIYNICTIYASPPYICIQHHIYTIGKHIHMYSMHTVYITYTNNTCIRNITCKTYVYYSYHIIYTHHNM